MESKVGAQLSPDGIVANGVPLRLRKWIKERSDLGSVFADKATAFAYVSSLVNSMTTEQCRFQLKLASNVNLAIICTVVSVHSHSTKGNVLTTWVCSDLSDNSLKLTIYGCMPAELECVDRGNIIAVLNPDMSDLAKDYNFRMISIKNCNNLLLIGEVDGLDICKGLTIKGEPCKNVLHVPTQGKFCKFHLKAATKGTKLRRKSIKERPTSQATMMDNIEDSYRDHEAVEEVHNFEFKSTEPAKPEKVLSHLRGLGNLMNKVIQSRKNPQSGRTHAAEAGATQSLNHDKYRKSKESVDRNRAFESSVGSLKNLMQQDYKEYKKIVVLLHMLGKNLNYIDKDVVTNTNVLSICSHLFDHPAEMVAIESLKLFRALKKTMQVPLKGSGKHGSMGDAAHSATDKVIDGAVLSCV